MGMATVTVMGTDTGMGMVTATDTTGTAMRI
jgi:hypothetical protein